MVTMIVRHRAHTYVLVLSSLALSPLAELYLFDYLCLLENDQKKSAFASAIYSGLSGYATVEQEDIHLGCEK